MLFRAYRDQHIADSEEGMELLIVRDEITDAEELNYHLEPWPGKYEMVSSTPMLTQRDLSLSYNPGVAAPVLAIPARTGTAYNYTVKGNTVAIVTNGTAILGLGNLGAPASKPVMDGKTTLFKRFVGVAKGPVWSGRTDGMNRWKSEHPTDTTARAVEGADVFIGVSVKGALTRWMIESMSADPIIFALANPDPEITPEEGRTIRADAIVATGRSDYPNQVDNVLCSIPVPESTGRPGGRDKRGVKIACAQALAGLARRAVPDAVE